LRRWLKGTLDRIDLFAVQNEEYAERFRQLGAVEKRVQATGSLKFDGAQANRENPNTMRLQKLAGFAADDVVFLAGSTQDPEERLALETFQALSANHPQLRLVIVPRHPHRFEEVAELLNQSGLSWKRRTELEKTCDLSARILLIDTIGELGAWWGTAQIGFVGGSLFSSRGGQNMIEPAAYGAAVCFGPNTQNFRDVVELLLSRNAAVRVHDGEELTAFVRRSLEDADYRNTLGHVAAKVVAQQQGATRRTGELLEPLLLPAIRSTFSRESSSGCQLDAA
jgi:3-deoxy-D-manno-octulosonic-acid transferase